MEDKYYFAFDIDYPDNKAGLSQWNKQFSLNAYYAGKHWSVRKKDAEFWHLLVLEAIHKTRQPITMASVPVTITVLFNDGLDCSNHAAMVKMIEDALKDKIIKDDSPKYVKGIYIGFHETHNIHVEVREYQEIV